MKFQVAKRDLEAALKVVSPSLSSSGSDLTAHYLFRVTSEKDGSAGVCVQTYAGRMFSSSPLKGKVLEGVEGAFSLEGKRLKKLLGFVEDAALEFTYRDAVVSIKTPKGTQKFPSLDPSKFPYWDKQVQEAKVTGTIPAARLASALEYVRHFVSDNEASEPNLCVTEARNSFLYATDKRALTLVKIKGLEDVCLRIHGKNLGGFLAFLSSFPEGTYVDVMEHDRSMMLRRGDGALFGEALFQARFPDLQVVFEEENHHTWVAPRADLLNGIGFLVSGASYEENRIRMTVDDGKILLSMTNQTGDRTDIGVPATLSSRQGAIPLPKDGFHLDHGCFTKILNAWKSLDMVEIGVVLMESKGILRGYTRFVNTLNDDQYLTIHAFLR
jgi:DNA polymerase III sliding clamp (beta) subunit (PCNA family)